MSEVMVDIDHLDVSYGLGAGAPLILKAIDTQVLTGHTVGLVGESGSGKSTLAKTLVGLVAPRAGRIAIDGTDITAMSPKERAALRRRVQMVPQDPYSSLDPRRTVGQALAEAIDPVRSDPRRHRDEIAEWLTTVAMDPAVADRFPHEFSGGQRQRIAIARALAVRPELIIADEITSALDVSVQAEILNLLTELRRRLRMTMIFISHNLAVVRHVSDDMVVLYHGEIVEQGVATEIYADPQHPYTRQLLASVPEAIDLDEGSSAAEGAA